MRALFYVGREAVEAPFPAAPVCLDPLRRVVEGRWAELALPRAPDLRRCDETDVLEDPDVLFDAVESQPERRGQLAERGRRACEPVEDPATRRVRQREERPVQCRVIVHRSVQCT